MSCLEGEGLATAGTCAAAAVPCAHSADEEPAGTTAAAVVSLLLLGFQSIRDAAGTRPLGLELGTNAQLRPTNRSTTYTYRRTEHMGAKLLRSKI